MRQITIPTANTMAVTSRLASARVPQMGRVTTATATRGSTIQIGPRSRGRFSKAFRSSSVNSHGRATSSPGASVSTSSAGRSDTSRGFAIVLNYGRAGLSFKVRQLAARDRHGTPVWAYQVPTRPEGFGKRVPIVSAIPMLVSETDNETRRRLHRMTPSQLKTYLDSLNVAAEPITAQDVS